MSSALLVIGLVTLAPWTAQAADGTGSVSGRVTLDAVPLAAGKLLLRRPGDKDKASQETPIKAGQFAIEMVAAGKYDVAIQGAGVPAKYASLDSSVLKVEIKAGSNTIDFDLVSRQRHACAGRIGGPAAPPFPFPAPLR